MKEKILMKKKYRIKKGIFEARCTIYRKMIGAVGIYTK